MTRAAREKIQHSEWLASAHVWHALMGRAFAMGDLQTGWLCGVKCTYALDRAFGHVKIDDLTPGTFFPPQT